MLPSGRYPALALMVKLLEVQSGPSLTDPKGTTGPGKTLPPLKPVPGAVPSVPMKGLTYCVQSVDCAEVRVANE